MSPNQHMHTHTELFGTMVAVFLMAFFYEGLKSLREYLVHLDLKKNPLNAHQLQIEDKNERTPLIGTVSSPPHFGTKE